MVLPGKKPITLAVIALSLPDMHDRGKRAWAQGLKLTAADRAKTSGPVCDSGWDTKLFHKAFFSDMTQP
jgi:hypothetical protein